MTMVNYKVGSYIRLSRDESYSNSGSIDNQIKMTDFYCKENKLEVIMKYDIEIMKKLKLIISKEELMKVVTICGSMKFKDKMMEVARDLEIKYVVIQCVYSYNIML